MRIRTEIKEEFADQQRKTGSKERKSYRNAISASKQVRNLYHKLSNFNSNSISTTILLRRWSRNPYQNWEEMDRTLLWGSTSRSRRWELGIYREKGINIIMMFSEEWDALLTGLPSTVFLSLHPYERERRRMIVLSWKWKGKDRDGTLESRMQGKIRGSSTESTTGKHDSWCLEEDGESSVTFPPTHAIETSRGMDLVFWEREVCNCFCREKGVQRSRSYGGEREQGSVVYLSLHFG